jgi:hypothetical protein
MVVDNSREDAWRAMQARHARERVAEQPDLPLKGGRGGGTYDGMEGRVSKLEAYMDETRGDMREIRSDLKAIIGKIGTLATKADVTTWKWQWIAASVALFAIILGSIIGGLGWLATITAAGSHGIP